MSPEELQEEINKITSQQIDLTASGPGGVDIRDERKQDYYSDLSNIFKSLKDSGVAKAFLDKSGNFDWLKLLTVLGAGYAGYKDKAPPSGGGVAYAYKGPAQQLTRDVVQSKYGPVAQFAAQGGIMQAYAGGGPVAMEDGGFVMTKKAVDGAGGPQGIQSLLPGARPIRGPGTGTSDSIPAYIQGPNGRTPARVSNGEAYVPPGRDTEGLYALMKSLERNA